MLVREGFTDVELLFVLAIMAVVMTMAWPAANRNSDQLRLHEAARTLEADIQRARLESVRRNAARAISRSSGC